MRSARLRCAGLDIQHEVLPRSWASRRSVKNEDTRQAVPATFGALETKARRAPAGFPPRRAYRKALARSLKRALGRLAPANGRPGPSPTSSRPRDLGNGAWPYKPKFDGYRCLLGRDGTGKTIVMSRNRKELGRYFPELSSLAAQLPASSIVDGEIDDPTTHGAAVRDRLKELV